MDIMRAWVKDHPVKMENIKDNSPARALLAKATWYVNGARRPYAPIILREKCLALTSC